MGVWNISYTTVSCESEWAGAKDQAAIGSVPAIGDGGCCPLDPIVRMSSPLYYISPSHDLPTRLLHQRCALLQTAVALCPIPPVLEAEVGVGVDYVNYSPDVHRVNHSMS